MPLGNGRVAEHSCAIRREPLPALRLVRRHRQNIDTRSGLRIPSPFIRQNAINRITISRARFTCGSFFRTRHCANNASSFNAPSRSRTRFACSSVFRVRLRATAGIINAVRQAGTRNPLILLDEIDKMGSDMRGDPASALLEVLDAEQNATFRDHFVELPFDLSDVLFITTANTTSTIPRPLLDRMEVIELPSYTDEEKLQIAKSYLLPKQLKRHGLKKSQVRMTDAAIRETIVSYTRESGVRVLEREIGALCRKAAMGIVSEEYKQAHVTGDNLEKFLGTRKYHPEKNGLENQVGLVNGLAWTAVGGTLLEAEANVVPGSGKVELTGNLGNVMKESARAAFTYIRSRAAQLGIDTDFYKEKDIHIHFPEGAVPKDGPSAGVTITTAMVSALTGIPVRGDVAMTGEVTLRGRVLPIGGLREKSMAALRNGIHTVLIPQDNEADLEEIDQTVRSALHFIPVSHVDQVLAHALEHPPLAQAEQGEDLTATPTEAAPAQTAVTQA